MIKIICLSQWKQQQHKTKQTNKTKIKHTSTTHKQKTATPNDSIMIKKHKHLKMKACSFTVMQEDNAQIFGKMCNEQLF